MIFLSVPHGFRCLEEHEGHWNPHGFKHLFLLEFFSFESSSSSDDFTMKSRTFNGSFLNQFILEWEKMSIVIKLKQGMSLFVKHVLPLSSTRVPHSAIYPLHWRLARSLSLNHFYGLYDNLYLTKSA